MTKKYALALLHKKRGRGRPSKALSEKLKMARKIVGGYKRNKRRKYRRNPDYNAFNTELNKELKRLKKDLGAENLRQNYKGTGSQVHRRQIWTRFPNDGCIDIWLDTGYVQLGGVVSNRPGGGGGYPNPRVIQYGDKTPQQVYAEIVAALKPWLTPGAALRKKRRKHK